MLRKNLSCSALTIFALLFALQLGAAFWYRRQPVIHKRLMLLAMLGPVSGAPVAHLLGHLPATQPHAAAWRMFIAYARTDQRYSD